MELFVGLPIPLDIARSLRCRIQDKVTGCKLSIPEDMHVTLQYLGESDPLEVVSTLMNVHFGSFNLQLSKLGGFDGYLWAGMDDAGGNLFRLKKKVDENLKGLAIPATHGFVPHITLAEGDFEFPQDVALEPSTLAFSSFKLYRVCEDGRFREIQDFPFSPSVRIACVNDFHATLDNAPRMVNHLKRFKKQNPDSLIVFGGDNYFGDPACDALDGDPVTQVMESLDVPFSSIGNHDYEYGKQQLRYWQKSGTFEFLCANIENGSDICRPYAIMEIASRRIAFLGLTTLDDMPSPETDAGMKWYPLVDSTAAAKKILDEVKLQKPDAVIALAHLGLKETGSSVLAGPEVLSLCERCPELDGVFAAHWHRFIKGRINGVAVAEGGGNGNGFAILDLVFTETGRPEVAPDYVLIHSEEPEDPVTRKLVEDAMNRTRSLLGDTVCTLACAIPHKDQTANAIAMTGSPFSNFVVNIAIQALAPDAVMLYSGRLGPGFNSGTLRLYEFKKNLMFKNNLYLISAKGSCLRWNISRGMRTLDKEGSSPLAIAGFKMTIDPARPLGQRVLSILDATGNELDDCKSYTVVIDEFMYIGSMGFDFSGADATTLLEDDLRAIVLRYVSSLKDLDEPTIRRMTTGWIENR